MNIIDNDNLFPVVIGLSVMLLATGWHVVASRSLPIVLAQGGVRRVSVVTSVWHLRTLYFFAPYRDHGLRVTLRPARPLHGWLHLLAEELGGVAGMRAQRRVAMADVRLPAEGAASGP